MLKLLYCFSFANTNNTWCQLVCFLFNEVTNLSKKQALINLSSITNLLSIYARTHPLPLYSSEQDKPSIGL